jgi:quercetin 2,3-dioxygenase
MTLDLRPADSRFHTRIGWLDSRHSFSFSRHYDPANLGHGLLLVHNDDHVAPASGFTTHAHRDMEIVTWVLSGRLEHRDSAGHHGVIVPGLAQRMSAGTGIRHSEMNPDPDDEVHFLQMWVPPDTLGLTPGYEQVDVTDRLGAGGWVPVASGRRDPTPGVHIHQRDATLWVARASAGERLPVPAAPHAHLFVASGTAHMEGLEPILGPGDAVRLSHAGELGVTVASDGTELVLWETA